jgi:hypothetical protein
MNYKGKTDPKFTTEVGIYVTMLHDSCIEKQITLYFARNTTTNYSPNWC